MKHYVIVVAGGSGLRMGADIPKQFLLLNGKPILQHTLEAFANTGLPLELILVLPKTMHTFWEDLSQKYQCTVSYQLAEGGDTRFHSVKNGLEKVTDLNGITFIHDGVRPFVSVKLIHSLLVSTLKYQAVVPTLPLIDSIRKEEKGVTRAVNRGEYCRVQTPQSFQTKLLKEAYLQDFKESFTDDASVVEALGEVSICHIAGEEKNIKITTPLDLLIAQHLL